MGSISYGYQISGFALFKWNARAQHLMLCDPVRQSVATFASSSTSADRELQNVNIEGLLAGRLVVVSCLTMLGWTGRSQTLEDQVGRWVS